MLELIYDEKVQVVLLWNGQNPGQSRVYVMVRSYDSYKVVLS